jgi:hypothetical protein
MPVQLLHYKAFALGLDWVSQVSSNPMFRPDPDREIKGYTTKVQARSTLCPSPELSLEPASSAFAWEPTINDSRGKHSKLWIAAPKNSGPCLRLVRVSLHGLPELPWVHRPEQDPCHQSRGDACAIRAMFVAGRRIGPHVISMGARLFTDVRGLR